jgi:hypothetical protein
LSSDTAKASATTFPDSKTQKPTGRTFGVRPVDVNLGYLNFLNHGYLLERYSLGFMPVL